MLAFDIETTGLDPSTNTVTAACAYDPARGIEKTFIFNPTSDVVEDPQNFLALLDAAPVICAFNGARFDLPFMQEAWKIPAERVDCWRLKLFDVYELSVQVFGEGFSLNQLLRRNGIDTKTACGKEAIVFAEKGQWQELGEYCMQDTIKTHQVSTLPVIRLPIHPGDICLHWSVGQGQLGFSRSVVI
jgi:hypothetical protein